MFLVGAGSQTFFAKFTKHELELSQLALDSLMGVASPDRVIEAADGIRNEIQKASSQDRL